MPSSTGAGRSAAGDRSLWPLAACVPGCALLGAMAAADSRFSPWGGAVIGALLGTLFGLAFGGALPRAVADWCFGPDSENIGKFATYALPFALEIRCSIRLNYWGHRTVRQPRATRVPQPPCLVAPRARTRQPQDKTPPWGANRSAAGGAVRVVECRPQDSFAFCRRRWV